MPETVSSPETLQLNEAVVAREVIDGLKPTQITDQEGFIRTRFDMGVNEPILLEFRGKEELPLVPDESVYSHVVVAGDERPVRTGSDRFGRWVKALCGDSVYGSTLFFEAPTSVGDVEKRDDKMWQDAIDRGSSGVVLHVPATPKGVIDAALQVAVTLGVSETSLQSLVDLRREFTDRRYSETSFNFMKDLFAVCQGLKSLGYSREAGFAVAVQSLAGDVKAQELFGKLTTTFDSAYFEHELVNRSLNHATGERIEVVKITEAGHEVDDELIKEIEKAGILAVHTTETRPLQDSIIRPTAEFNVGEPGQFPRDSIHFSLNHPVESHAHNGDFIGRPYTVIAPLAGLLRANGAPAALRDVDTYFISRPGEGIIMPTDAVVLEMASHGDFFINTGRNIVINTNEIKSVDDVRVLAHALAQLSGLDGSLYYNRDNTELNMLRDLGMDEMYTVKKFNELISAADVSDELKNMMRQYAIEVETRATGGRLQEEQRVNEYHLKRLFAESLPKLFADKNTGSYLQERLRILVVNSIIKGKGGKVVKGGMHYVQDTDFQRITGDFAFRMGVSSELHSNTPEAFVEQILSERLSAATTHFKDEQVKGFQKGDFDWTKYDTEQLWSILSIAPDSARARAIEMGLLDPTDLKVPQEIEEFVDVG